MLEAEYKKTSKDFFRKIKGTWKTEKPEVNFNPYEIIINNFAEAVIAYDREGRTDVLLADGKEGRNSLLMSNAIYLSSWTRQMVTLPEQGTDEEKEFEAAFEAEMGKLTC